MTALVTDSGPKAPARLAGSAILSMQSDERLVELVREGHERAFDAIVSRYRKSLTRFAGRFLPESRTEDAVQQAFINAHGALLSTDEPVQLKPWLFTITRNASLNMVRQNGWNYEQIPLDFDGVRRPDQIVEQRIELQSTVAAVGALPDRQRDAIVMREFEGRSYQEIAVALGANDGAVRQLLNRARGTLRTAVSALTPPPILARAAASLPPSDGRRLAEVFGSLGAAGLAKAGATALVAGSLVVGAVNAPLPLVGGEHHAAKASHAALVKAAPVASESAATPVSTENTRAHHNSGSAPAAVHHGSRHAAAHNPAAIERSGERRGSDGGGDRSGSGEHRSGSDDSGRSGSDSPTSGGSHEGSGGGTSGGGSDDHSTSGSGTSSGPGGGSDDTATTTTGSTDGGGSTSGSGDSGSGSGTSGSGSGTDTSGSGTSGSGSGTETSTSTSTSGSGSSGSGSGELTSGSGTSGSGTSGSGSDDPILH